MNSNLDSLDSLIDVSLDKAFEHMDRVNEKNSVKDNGTHKQDTKVRTGNG